jgi:undecaprenyl-diphosphatase
MVDGLIDLDKKIFLALNHFTSPVADPVMRLLSGPVPWVLFFAAFLFLLIKRDWLEHRKNFFISLVLLSLTYLIADQASVHLFKEVFMRLRPCHEPDLAGQVRLITGHCGGQYGFVSSHAANSFALATLTSLVFRYKWLSISLFVWAALISYSRVYLGVHYPGDILCGALLGSLCGAVVFYGNKMIFK